MCQCQNYADCVEIAWDDSPSFDKGYQNAFHVNYFDLDLRENIWLPIFNLQGNQITETAGTASIYDADSPYGDIIDPVMYDQFGDGPPPASSVWPVWTGSDQYGERRQTNGWLGGTSSSTGTGRATEDSDTWLYSTWTTDTATLPIYALSEPITVIPEPTTCVLALAACCLAVARYGSAR